MAKTLVRRISKSAKEVLKKLSSQISRKHILKIKEMMRIGISFRKAYSIVLEKTLSDRGGSEHK